MTEPDVALTDFAIAVECAAFAVLRARGRRDPLTAMFALTGLGAVTGGLVHGFAADEASRAYRILWPATLLAIIGASLALAIAAADLLGAPRAIRPALWIVAVAAGAFVLSGHDDFLIAVAVYVPASLAAAAGFAVRRASLGAAGLLLGIAAGFLQQRGYTPLPATLSHNAFYHLIQMAALALVYAGARRYRRSGGGDGR